MDCKCYINNTLVPWAPWKRKISSQLIIIYFFLLKQKMQEVTQLNIKCSIIPQMNYFLLNICKTSKLIFSAKINASCMFSFTVSFSVELSLCCFWWVPCVPCLLHHRGLEATYPNPVCSSQQVMKLPEVDSPPQTVLINKNEVCSHSERPEEWKTKLLVIRTLA